MSAAGWTAVYETFAQFAREIELEDAQREAQARELRSSHSDDLTPRTDDDEREAT